MHKHPNAHDVSVIVEHPENELVAIVQDKGAVLVPRVYVIAGWGYLERRSESRSSVVR